MVKEWSFCRQIGLRVDFVEQCGMAEFNQDSGQLSNKGAGRGGKRAGAGRPKSAPSIKTRDIAEAMTRRGHITPLEVLLKCMAVAYKAKDWPASAEYAKAAAPYLHARLQAVEVTGRDGKDLTPSAPIIHLVLKK
jgi:hypothetical protein